MFDAGRPEGVPASVARHVLGRVLRAPRGARGRAQGELPDARPDALERRPPPRPGEGRLVHDDGAGHVPRRRTIRRRSTSASSRSRRRGSSSTTSGSPTSSPSSGTATRSPPTSARPGGASTSSTSCPSPFPGRGVPLGARPPSRHAALLGRRALVREPLGAQGRDALLDERERRRQVAARVRRPRHPHGQGLRRRPRRRSCSAFHPASSRGASRSTRSSTG